MLEGILNQSNITFLIGAALSVICGFLIGIERESREKPAGISTNIFVCFGAMLFTLLSAADQESKTRIAAGIVTGIGFLGAGIIIHDKRGIVSGLTTAASVWFTAAIGMAIGFGWYFAAVVSALVAIIVPRIPRFSNPAEDPYLRHESESRKGKKTKAKV